MKKKLDDMWVINVTDQYTWNNFGVDSYIKTIGVYPTEKDAREALKTFASEDGEYKYELSKVKVGETKETYDYRIYRERVLKYLGALWDMGVLDFKMGIFFRNQVEDAETISQLKSIVKAATRESADRDWDKFD